MVVTPNYLSFDCMVFKKRKNTSVSFSVLFDVEVLFYVHRNRWLIRDGSPGRPPRLSHSSWALVLSFSLLSFNVGEIVHERMHIVLSVFSYKRRRHTKHDTCPVSCSLVWKFRYPVSDDILKPGKELVKTVIVTVSGKCSSKIVIKSTTRSITKLLMLISLASDIFIKNKNKTLNLLDLKVVIVAAFLMCGSNEFQTKRLKWEKARSPFVLYLYSGVLGDGCQHWSKEAEQENRDEGYQREKRE